MTQHNRKRAQVGSADAESIKLRLSPVAFAVMAVMASGTAMAQEQTVTVTGIRASIENAINVKKSSDSIVEAISSEDLGKLPDTSVAEAMARMPGVAAQRTGGRAQQISIRGMAPDFSTALLNGREQVTTGESRGVEFDQYPSELLSAVVVYKTPDGALLGQGLSGTVDLQTIRPLDSSTKGLAVNYRRTRLGVKAAQEGEGKRLSLSFSNKFADNKVGVAFGFARLDETGPLVDKFNTWSGFPYSGFGLEANQTNQTRDGAMLVLQAKPSDKISTSLDVFYSKFEADRAKKMIEGPLFDTWAAADGIYDRPPTTTPAAGAKSVTADNVRLVVQNRSIKDKDELLSLGWKTEYKVSKDLTLEADISRSKAESKGGGEYESYAGVPVGSSKMFDTVSVTDQGVFTTGLNYSDRSLIKLTDVMGWGGGVTSPQAGYVKLPSNSDELSAVRLAAKTNVSWGPIERLNAGINFTDREKTRAFTEARLTLGTNPFASADIPGTGTINLGGLNVVSYDPAAVASLYTQVKKVHPDIYNKDWTVNEKVTTAYAKGSLSTQLLGKDTTGNIGFQVVKTDQDSLAFNVDRSICKGDTVAACPSTNVSGGKSYTDVLPSLNLAMDVGNDSVVRFGLARVLARPTVNDMRASKSVGYDAQKNLISGDGGNPELEPFRANAIDVSYEKYFGSKGYVGAAAFYKKLSTYVLRQSVDFDFSSLITPGTEIPAGVSAIGQMTSPQNGQGGNIRGLELSASLPLDLLAKPLSGFGLVLNHAITKSSVSLNSSGFALDNVATSTIPLPGLSERVTNMTAYYERDGFSVRFAQRKRSDFVGEVSNFAGDRTLTYIKGERVVDAQVGYEIQSGHLKGLGLVFQASNLNDAKFIRYRDTPENVVESVTYGRTYLMGVNYKF